MKINYVMFDVTNRCNFNCKHCYKETPLSKIDMELSVILEFIAKLDQTEQKPHIILSGGEPLMYSHLYDLLNSICKDHFVRINTNAYYLDKHIANLAKYKNLELQISMDGYDEESFFLVRNNHFFSQILDNACLGKKNGLNTFFRTTLTSQSISKYDHFIDLSHKTGIPLILRPVVYTGATSQESLAIEPDLLTSWHHECIMKGLSRYVGEYIVSPHCPLLNNNPSFSTLTVDVLGNVYPCMLLKSKKYYMGNIYTDGFEQIFECNDRLKNHLLNELNDTECIDCGFRKKYGDGTCVISCYLNKKNCIKKHIC